MDEKSKITRPIRPENRRDPSTTLTGVPAVSLTDGIVPLVHKTTEPVPLVNEKRPIVEEKPAVSIGVVVDTRQLAEKNSHERIDAGNPPAENVVQAVNALCEQYVRGPERIHVRDLPQEEYLRMKDDLEGEGYIYMGKQSKSQESYDRLLYTREEKFSRLRNNLANLTEDETDQLREANRIEKMGFINKVQEECWKYRQKGYDIVTITTDNAREKGFKAVHIFYRKPKK